MKASHRWLLRCTMIACITIFCLPSINYTQEKDREIITFIMLEITTPKGIRMKASTAEGEMITIVDEKTEMGYGFTPVVRSLESRSVEVKAFQVTGKAMDVKALREIESIEIKMGAQQKLSSIPFGIKVLAITQDFKDQDVPNESAGKPPDQLARCCVQCFGQNYCAGCSVLTDCGCCCKGGFCCAPCNR